MLASRGGEGEFGEKGSNCGIQPSTSLLFASGDMQLLFGVPFPVFFFTSLRCAISIAVGDGKFFVERSSFLGSIII